MSRSLSSRPTRALPTPSFDALGHGAVVPVCRIVAYGNRMQTAYLLPNPPRSVSSGTAILRYLAHNPTGQSVSLPSSKTRDREERLFYFAPKLYNSLPCNLKPLQEATFDVKRYQTDKRPSAANLVEVGGACAPSLLGELMQQLIQVRVSIRALEECFEVIFCWVHRCPWLLLHCESSILHYTTATHDTAPPTTAGRLRQLEGNAAATHSTVRQPRLYYCIFSDTAD
ncbi:hypothetical protein J6590_000273 [Homalodisca vitripennis]|nr:hypothetical protein J6590_000273 [Homalodisca vitripennis]